MFENVIVYTLGRECGTTFLVQFMQFSILDLELDCSGSEPFNCFPSLGSGWAYPKTFVHMPQTIASLVWYQTPYIYPKCILG